MKNGRDKNTLKYSHENDQSICDFVSLHNLNIYEFYFNFSLSGIVNKKTMMVSLKNDWHILNDF